MMEGTVHPARRSPGTRPGKASPPWYRQMLHGAGAGALATVPMSLAMKGLQLLLPWWEQYPLPPSEITEKVARRVGLGSVVEHDSAHLALTALSHFGFGASAAAPYPLLGRNVAGIPGVWSGMLYALVVWAASYLGWIPGLRILPPATEHPRGRTLLMIIAHVVWGATLGVLVPRAERDR